MVLHSERWTLTDDFHQPQHSDPPPRLVCLGTPLATCALPTGVFYLLTYLLHCAAAAALASTSVLARALSKPRPVIVHVYDARPSELLPYAIEDVSMACRESGATAVLVGPELVECFAKEQESARGNFPGPLPVIVDTALRDMGTSPEELCAGAKTLGASAIGLRYYTGDYPDAAALEAALQRAVAAAEASSLTTILLGEFGADGAEGVAGAAAMASSVGAAAALTKGNEQGGAPAFGCWRGSEDELQRLRTSGVDGLIIKNACRGDVGRGAHLKLPSPAAVLVTRQVRRELMTMDDCDG